jgi:membrane protease YdiL (CAAX protease family)
VARASLIAASIFLLAHARKLLDFWSMGMRVELPIMALAIFVMGLVLGATARPVRSIWIATLVHGINNLLSSL